MSIGRRTPQQPDECRVCREALERAPRLPLDPCVTSLVLALNASGFRTEASCCGHGVRPACIWLADGRQVHVADFDMSKLIHELFPRPFAGDDQDDAA